MCSLLLYLRCSGGLLLPRVPLRRRESSFMAARARRLFLAALALNTAQVAFGGSDRFRATAAIDISTLQRLYRATVPHRQQPAAFL